MAVSDTYTVPSDMAGGEIYVKCMDPALSGIVKCGSESIQGFTGTAKISGNAVVGHTCAIIRQSRQHRPEIPVDAQETKR